MTSWESSTEAIRWRALELAVKIGDPDTPIGLAELLVNADAIVRYINGVDRNVIGLRWRQDMLALQPREVGDGAATQADAAG